MEDVMSDKKPTPSGKPVKPKKPLPTKEEPVKIPVPCSLTEERAREIAGEEIEKYMQERTIPVVMLDWYTPKDSQAKVKRAKKV